MESEQIGKFLDSVIEAAYQRQCFPKEAVAEVLAINEFIKNKLMEGEQIAAKNTELNVKVETLEAENQKYKDRFGDYEKAIEEHGQTKDPNEIDVNQPTDENDVKTLPIMAEIENNHAPKKQDTAKLQK